MFDASLLPPLGVLARTARRPAQYTPPEAHSFHKLQNYVSLCRARRANTHTDSTIPLWRQTRGGVVGRTGGVLAGGCRIRGLAWMGPTRGENMCGCRGGVVSAKTSVEPRGPPRGRELSGPGAKVRTSAGVALGFVAGAPTSGGRSPACCCARLLGPAAPPNPEPPPDKGEIRGGPGRAAAGTGLGDKAVVVLAEKAGGPPGGPAAPVAPVMVVEGPNLEPGW